MQHYLPYLNWIDTRQSFMKDLVIAWGNINSHAMNRDGLAIQLSALKESFQDLGGTMQEVELAPYTAIDEHGRKIERPLGHALIIKKRPKAPLQILFSGHMDTVYSQTSTFQKVSESAPGTILGPGVCDMKGGLVVLLTALQAFEKSPYAKEIGWEIIINPDEEIGSPGSSTLLEEAAKRSHFGLVFEPAHADGAIVAERPGSMNLVLVVHGKSAHAGRDHDKGRSALTAAVQLVQQIEALHDPQNHLIVNVGEFRSGNSFNVVPDLAIIRINVRAHTQEELQKIKETISKLQSKEDTSFELHEQISRPPKALSSETNRLLNFYKECSELQNIPYKVRASGGVSDANTLAYHGLATLDTLGPVGGDIHTHNEYVVIESLKERAKLTALLLMRLGNGEFASKPKNIEL